jgi:F-type H+-transporting ATPase subunit gamma
MAQSLREIKNRIRGISNVNKVTHAMEMISIAKLRPVKNQFLQARQFSLKIEALLKDLLSGAKNISHPLLKERKVLNKMAICLITSDTGLCGNYNHNVIRVVEDFINKYGRDKIMLITVGKKGLTYFKKRGVDIAHSYTELHGRYSDEIAGKILDYLTELFLSGKTDEAYVAYTYFESASRHRPTIEKLLNISSPAGKEDVGYILEPDMDAILKELVPAYLLNKVKAHILSAFTAEHSARAVAMGQATKNADELLEDLTLLRNKMRQAGITREIMEIVSSAEVLR